MNNQLAFELIRLDYAKITELLAQLKSISADLEWDVWTDENYLRPMSEKDFWSQGLMLDQKLISYAIISRKDAATLHIHRFFVDAASRGKDIGRQFLNKLFDMLREKCNAVTLIAPSFNTRAIHFYTRYGFKQVAIENDDVHFIYSFEDSTL